MGENLLKPECAYLRGWDEKLTKQFMRQIRHLIGIHNRQYEPFQSPEEALDVIEASCHLARFYFEHDEDFTSEQNMLMMIVSGIRFIMQYFTLESKIERQIAKRDAKHREG